MKAAPHALILLILAAPLGAREFTLQQAIESALRQNRDLRAAELSLENSRYGVEAAAATFAWTLRPNSEVSASGPIKTTQLGVNVDKVSTLGTEITAGPQINTTTGDNIEAQKSAALQIQIQQPLFRRFGALENRETLTRAEHSVLTARRDLEMRRNDLVVQVVQTHEGLVQLQQKEDFDRQSLERLEKIYRLTKAREKQGRASRVDVLRADLQRGRAESSLQTTRSQIEARRRDFADLLGLAPTTDTVAVAGTRLEIAAPSKVTAVAVALSNRLDLAQVLQDLGDAERGVKIARKNLQPDISLVARYDWLGQGKSYQDAVNLNDTAWFIGLSAGNNDLLQHGERAQLKQAQAGQLTASLQVDVVRYAVERQILNELTAYNQAVQQAAVEESNYVLAVNRAKLARRLYEMDRGDSFTVSDAENELLASQTTVLTARAEANIAAYRVLRALGTLLEAPADLKPIGPSLQSNPQ